MCDGMSPLTGSYLAGLASKTGGRLFRADDREALTQAFSSIAEDLRRQYSLGYYPKNATVRGQVRKIKVSISRPGVAVRAKESYTSDSSGGVTEKKPNE